MELLSTLYNRVATKVQTHKGRDGARPTGSHNKGSAVRGDSWEAPHTAAQPGGSARQEPAGPSAGAARRGPRGPSRIEAERRQDVRRARGRAAPAAGRSKRWGKRALSAPRARDAAPARPCAGSPSRPPRASTSGLGPTRAAPPPPPAGARPACPSPRPEGACAAGLPSWTAAATAAEIERIGPGGTGVEPAPDPPAYPGRRARPQAGAGPQSALRRVFL